MPYRVTVDGAEFTTDDLTLDEAITIEQATGTPWTQINPIRSGEHCKLVMVAFLSRTRPVDEAVKLVGAFTLREVLDSVTWVAEDLPEEYEDGLPKAGDAPPTG